jgi:hypothetical protein
MADAITVVVHLTSQDLNLYSFGWLSAQAEARVEEHVHVCEECRKLLNAKMPESSECEDVGTV